MSLKLTLKGMVRKITIINPYHNIPLLCHGCISHVRKDCRSSGVAIRTAFVWYSLIAERKTTNQSTGFISRDFHFKGKDCSLNVYACGRQKALPCLPAYCIAANGCNNSQATQSITMCEFPRNRPAVRRKWVKFVQFKRADFYAAPQSRPFV